MSEATREFVTSLAGYFQSRAADFFMPEDEDGDREIPETGVLCGWVLVAEWMGDDGERWMTTNRPPAQAMWLTRGLLSEAIGDLP